MLLLSIVAIASYISINKEGGKCMSDPANYLVKILEKQSNSKAFCGCSFSNPLIKPVSFSNDGVTSLNNSFP